LDCSNICIFKTIKKRAGIILNLKKIMTVIQNMKKNIWIFMNVSLMDYQITKFQIIFINKIKKE
jgi:hypothetical protein